MEESPKFSIWKEKKFLVSYDLNQSLDRPILIYSPLIFKEVTLKKIA